MTNQDPKSKVLPPVRVSEDLHTRLCELAAEQGHTLSSLVRHLLQQSIPVNEGGQP